MQEQKELQAVVYAASTPWTREFQGRVFNSILGKFSGTVTQGGGGAMGSVFTDPALKLFGPFELVQDETPLLRLTAQQTYWLASIVEGTPGILKCPHEVGAGASDSFAAAWTLDFSKMVGPFGMVDARTSKLYARGTHQAITAYTTDANLSAITGTFRQAVRTTKRIPRSVNGGFGYLRPQFYSTDIDASSSSSNLQHTIRFEQDSYVPGIMLMTKDTSAGGGTAAANNPQASRADGLVKNIKVDIQARDINGEFSRGTWGEYRANTWKGCGYGGSADAAADLTSGLMLNPLNYVPNGVIWIPTIDESSVRANGARLFRRGDALTFTFDTSATVESEFSAVTPAAGDLIEAVVPAFVPVMVGEDAQAPGSASVELARASGAFNRQRGRALGRRLNALR